jgi:ubiquinone/menaquinone biosynthesis C-methylase UbiE
MPPEEMWQQFFNPSTVLAKMQLTPIIRDVVDFGCGFGTLSIPAAQIVRGTVHAIDIDAEMIAATRDKAHALGLQNVNTIQRDFVSEGTGLADASVDYVMLFNILHAEDPATLLREARRILRPQGILAITHWNYDSETPRGPSMSIRPRPEQCVQWAKDVGFAPSDGPIDLPPYHYGWLFRR